MANWTTLKTAIANVIKTNGNQEITGAVLQNTLNSIVNAIGENATFAGIAKPTTNPGTPDGPVFYITSISGLYPNFGGLTIVEEGINIIFNCNNAWHYSALVPIVQNSGQSASQIMSQKAVTDFVNEEYNTLRQYVRGEGDAADGQRGPYKWMGDLADAQAVQVALDGLHVADAADTADMVANAGVFRGTLTGTQFYVENIPTSYSKDEWVQSLRGYFKTDAAGAGLYPTEEYHVLFRRRRDGAWGTWKRLHAGRPGAAPGAEVFNDYEGGNAATGTNSHAEGTSTTASGDSSHAEGYRTKATGRQSHAEGYQTVASGLYSHAEGYQTVVSGQYSHAEGYCTQATGTNSHAEGVNTEAGAQAHAEGNGSVAGDTCHAEGKNTQATGNFSHSEGDGTIASGPQAHAEGCRTQATGRQSHAEGKNTQATGHYSHSEGMSTTASADNTHAEGYLSQAMGKYAHAEGQESYAQGVASHAEGQKSYAQGVASHAEGNNTQATNMAEHAEGSYNASHTGTRHSIGIGTSDTARKNAVEVMDDGRVFVHGIGGYNGTNPASATTLQDVVKGMMTYTGIDSASLEALSAQDSCPQRDLDKAGFTEEMLSALCYGEKAFLRDDRIERLYMLQGADCDSGYDVWFSHGIPGQEGYEAWRVTSDGETGRIYKLTS